ncbi:hypothetical protein [Mycolicibacterium fortuitum]|uniref:hypothetical protein n=1 Tax=Mycolicibacterium fortuitum TaxID=1766 RepID=UPI001CDD144E|nr:hypothetical protein [Mycolicibacterium fortuitum]MCA4751498.1 hypothetical protein [Mycolicibacterium fortuitum]UBV22446.1 hypothetical protein H8Z59_04385 [Mycolicibacterium fortuitum]WAY18871.1 hypothetical protein OF855_27070 [Mycolicibacterium fortuitum]
MTRKDRFLLAGVAMVSASAIAVTPVAQNTTVIEQAKSFAYDLTASTMDATASPVDVYGTLVSNTFSNLELLGAALAANPAPFLSQVLENQQGYAAKFGAAFEAIPTNLKNWYEGPNGQARLAQAQEALEAGDIGEAYRWFNHSMLYAFQGAFGSLIAPGFILSGIPRGGTEYLAGIPEQIAQNFTNVIAATFTSSVVVSAVFQGVFATVSGPAFELARVAEAISTSVAAGDVQGAFNAVVNTPGILVNAALNGFKYSDPDPETGTGGYTEWPALLTWAEPGEQGGARVVAGLLQNLLVNIPKTLADAIDNTPETPAPASAPSSVPASISAQLVSAIAPKAAVTEPVVEAVKEAAPAAEAVKTEAPVAEAVKVETPVAEAVKVETPVSAVPAATDEAAADAATTPATAKSVSVDDTGTSKAKITDRIRAKFNDAKEARQAKAKESKGTTATDAAAKDAPAKETKAKETKAKETKPKATKAGGAEKSKGSSDSKKSSGSDS